MRSCGSFNWIPHITLDPAVVCPKQYHHVSFADVTLGDETKRIAVQPSPEDQDDAKTDLPPPDGSWSILAVLEHLDLSSNLSSVSHPQPIRLRVNKLETLILKPNIVEAKDQCNKLVKSQPRPVSLQSTDLTPSPLSCATNTDAENQEINSLELEVDKEFSPSNSTAIQQGSTRKEAELYSFLFDGEDTDSDDDIFPPSRISLEATYGVSRSSTSTECSSVVPSPTPKVAVPQLVHAPCRNLWEFM